MKKYSAGASDGFIEVSYFERGKWFSLPDLTYSPMLTDEIWADVRRFFAWKREVEKMVIFVLEANGIEKAYELFTSMGLTLDAK